MGAADVEVAQVQLIIPGQVDLRRLHQIFVCPLCLPDLGGQEGVDTCAQAGAVLSARFIILPVFLLHLFGERISQQAHEQHYIRLLDDLSIHSQPGGAAQVFIRLDDPGIQLLQRQIFSLEVPVKLLDDQPRSRLRQIDIFIQVPDMFLLIPVIKLCHQLLVSVRVISLKKIQYIEGRLCCQPDHVIRIGVVVHPLVVLVRPGHIQEFKPLFVFFIVSIRIKEPGALQDHFRGAFQQDFFIPCHLHVFPEPVCHIRTDMDLFIPEIRPDLPACKDIGQVIEGASVFSVFLALPWVECPAVSVFRRFLSRPFQVPHPVHDQVPRDCRITERKHREHVDLRIPEHAPFIYLA